MMAGISIRIDFDSIGRPLRMTLGTLLFLECTMQFFGVQTLLDLTKLFLTDLSPLLTLENLEELNLQSNKWRNIDLVGQLDSLKKVHFTYQGEHYKDYLSLHKKGIDVLFEDSLDVFFTIEVYKILSSKNWDKYNFFLGMGLNPETMLPIITGWSNRPFFDDIVTKIDIFEDAYAGTSAVGYHAKWVQREGIAGGNCIKFTDQNEIFSELDTYLMKYCLLLFSNQILSKR